MNDLAWVDAAFGEPCKPSPRRWAIKPQGDTECQHCKRVSPFKDIYFSHCKHCVRDAHPELA